MQKIVKFSKSLDDLSVLKKDFIDSNVKHLKNSIKINNLYKKQPIRKFCINCGSKKLNDFIESFGIKYKLCSRCGHLNGIYELTDYFIKKIYSKDTANYQKNYQKNYNLRVKKIYNPKVKFLKRVIKKKIQILDFGCGAGHFLKALEMNRISGTGFDMSSALIKLGKKILKKNELFLIKENEIHDIIKKNKNSNTLSMISVLEHLANPNSIFDAFKKSKLRYLYVSVPLFSFSVFIENAFKNVYPRQLGGPHTHLYTEKSLNHLAKKHDLKIIGEHWFGTDMSDLMRSIIANKNKINKKIYFKEFKSKFLDYMDELQAALDRNKACSEVHMIFEKK